MLAEVLAVEGGMHVHVVGQTALHWRRCLQLDGHAWSWVERPEHIVMALRHEDVVALVLQVLLVLGRELVSVAALFVAQFVQEGAVLPDFEPTTFNASLHDEGIIDAVVVRHISHHADLRELAGSVHHPLPRRPNRVTGLASSGVPSLPLQHVLFEPLVHSKGKLVRVQPFLLALHAASSPVGWRLVVVYGVVTLALSMLIKQLRLLGLKAVFLLVVPPIVRVRVVSYVIH